MKTCKDCDYYFETTDDLYRKVLYCNIYKGPISLTYPECEAHQEIRKLQEEITKLKDEVECPTCKGDQFIETQNSTLVKCPECNGTGKKYRN